MRAGRGKDARFVILCVMLTLREGAHTTHPSMFVT